MTASTSTLDSRAPETAGEHMNRLFLGCFFSIFATSSAFIVRAMVITEWGKTFNLTEAQKGAIFPGAALFPFAISIVLFSLILSTGIGSFISESVLLNTPGRIAAWALSLALYIVFLSCSIDGLLHDFIRQALPVRVALCIGLIFPCGLLMGFAFPTGMRMAGKVAESLTPWFWGINGAAGVVASALAMAISIGCGLNAT